MAKRRSGTRAAAKRNKAKTVARQRPAAGPEGSGLDALPVGFARFDARGCLVAWNAGLARIGGYPRRLLKAGTPLAEFVRVEVARGEHGSGDPEARLQARLAVLAQRKRSRREFALAEARVVRIASQPIAPRSLLITCEDVSAARRAEARQAATAEILKVIAR